MRCQGKASAFASYCNYTPYDGDAFPSRSNRTFASPSRRLLKKQSATTKFVSHTILVQTLIADIAADTSTKKTKFFVFGIQTQAVQMNLSCLWYPYGGNYLKEKWIGEPDPKFMKSSQIRYNCKFRWCFSVPTLGPSCSSRSHSIRSSRCMARGRIIGVYAVWPFYGVGLMAEKANDCELPYY